MRQLIKLITFIMLFGQVFAQSPVINLGECSFNLVSPKDPLDLPRDGTFRWELTPAAPDTTAGWYCRDENEAEGPENERVYRVESTYRGRVYGCPENPPNDLTQACMYHEICNFDPGNTPACIAMNHDGGTNLSSNTKNEDGDGLFTLTDERSPCFIETNGAEIDLTTIEPNEVQFKEAVLGIEHHCRELLSLYQNQLTRNAAPSHDVFSLNNAYTSP